MLDVVNGVAVQLQLPGFWTVSGGDSGLSGYVRQANSLRHASDEMSSIKQGGSDLCFQQD